jgi:Uncharacterised protein family (UPF0158)
MTISAALDDLINALEEQSDTLYSFLDRETGEVFLMSDESLSLGEAEPEKIESLPGWQREEAEVAKLIATTERYLPLPSRFEVNEWNIMRDFCEQIKQDKARNSLVNAVHGNHAFRKFKDQIASHNLWKPWNQFRRSALEEILRPWCEENGITLRRGKAT